MTRTKQTTHLPETVLGRLYADSQAEETRRAKAEGRTLCTCGEGDAPGLGHCAGCAISKAAAKAAKQDAARGNTPAATVAYSAKVRETASLLQKIVKQLEKHQRQQGADSRNWGFPGDLAHVNEELAQVLASLGDRSAVDAMGLAC